MIIVRTKEVRASETGEMNMITRTIIALAVALGTTGGALAATKHPVNPPRESAFETRNSYIAPPALSAYGSEDPRDQHNDR